MSGRGRPDRDMPEGVWQYKARWRSPIGYITILFVLITAIGLLPALAGAGRFTWPTAVIAALFGGVTWLVGRPLFTNAWIVRIGPRGISGHALKGRTIPWRDVRDLEVQTVQGNAFIVLTLAPDATESLQKTKRWFSGRKPERRIPLTGLKPKEIAEVTGAAHETFAAKAGVHAAAAVQARQEEVELEASFQEDLARSTPVTWALYTVVALNVGVWLANVFAGLSPMRPTSQELFRWGANSAWAVTQDHEYWRMLTGTFLHGGLVHLAMNMIGLWGAGKLLNRMYGNGHFLLVYLASALAGSAASLHFGAQSSVSVGASGAVFGVLGAVIVAVRKNRERVPKAVTRSIMTSEGVFLLYALANGFLRQGIDNAAHVGGLLAGAALAWVLVPVVDAQQRSERGKRAAAVAAGMVVAVGAVVAMTPTPRVDHRNFFAADAQIQQVLPRLRAAHEGMQKDAAATKAGKLPEPELIDKLEKVHLPALRAVNADLVRIPRAHGDPGAEATEDMRQLTAKTIEGLELQVRMHRGQAAPDAAEHMKKLDREIQLTTKRLQDRAAAVAAAKKP